MEGGVKERVGGSGVWIREEGRKEGREGGREGGRRGRKGGRKREGDEGRELGTWSVVMCK